MGALSRAVAERAEDFETRYFADDEAPSHRHFITGMRNTQANVFTASCHNAYNRSGSYSSGTHMPKHKTGTREEWLAARLKLLDEEKALTRQGDELTRKRMELPWVRVDKDYRFDTDEGRASLADLFRGRSQLIIYHFMLGPDFTAGCPACSSIADGFNGFAVHLANHDVMLMAVSRAHAIEKNPGVQKADGLDFSVGIVIRQ